MVPARAGCAGGPQGPAPHFLRPRRGGRGGRGRATAPPPPSFVADTLRRPRVAPLAADSQAKQRGIGPQSRRRPSPQPPPKRTRCGPPSPAVPDAPSGVGCLPFQSHAPARDSLVPRPPLNASSTPPSAAVQSPSAGRQPLFRGRQHQIHSKRTPGPSMASTPGPEMQRSGRGPRRETGGGRGGVRKAV